MRGILKSLSWKKPVVIEKTPFFFLVNWCIKTHIQGTDIVSCSEVDETRAYYTEWSKPERKTPIQYINAYIWNLEKW